MSISKPRCRRMLAIFLTVGLAACDRVPNCDGPRAEDLVEKTVYLLASRAFDEDRQASIKSRDRHHGDAVEFSDRDEAITDFYFPYFATLNDRRWLRPRLEAQVPENYRAAGVSIFLMRSNFKAIRKAVKVRLIDHVHLPDRTENSVLYTKVCRATLLIQPTIESAKPTTPITLTYSANAAPRHSGLHIDVNFFEATVPPLSFPLSDKEKLMLFALGVRKEALQAVPGSRAPIPAVTQRALRAFRRYLEAMDVSSAKAHESPPS
jgi:hypothetical protein